MATSTASVWTGQGVARAAARGVAGGAQCFGDGDGDVNGNGYGWCGGVRRWIKPAEDSENGETLE